MTQIKLLDVRLLQTRRVITLGWIKELSECEGHERLTSNMNIDMNIVEAGQ